MKRAEAHAFVGNPEIPRVPSRSSFLVLPSSPLMLQPRLFYSCTSPILLRPTLICINALFKSKNVTIRLIYS